MKLQEFEADTVTLASPEFKKAFLETLTGKQVSDKEYTGFLQVLEFISSLTAEVINMPVPILNIWTTTQEEVNKIESIGDLALPDKYLRATRSVVAVLFHDPDCACGIKPSKPSMQA